MTPAPQLSCRVQTSTHTSLQSYPLLRNSSYRIRTRRIRVCLLVLLCQFAYIALAFAADPATLLLQVKFATGGDAWNNIRSIHILGKSVQGGLTRSVEEWDDVRVGRYVIRSQSPLTAGADGFDGVSVWTQVKGGQSYVLGDEDARLGAINASYQTSFAYWFPQRRPATMQDGGAKAEEGRTFDLVTITPASGRPFSIWVDRATHLIDRFVEQQAEEVSVVRFSDYRTVEGVKLPFNVRKGREDSDAWDVETIDSVTLNSPLARNEFALPFIPPPDFQLQHGKTSTTVPFQIEGNKILVPVKLNGQGPFLAVFDSGGNYLLQPAVVAKLKLQAEGTSRAYGGGEGSVASGRVVVETMDIGEIRLSQQSANVFIFAEDAPERILIGSEILQRFAIKLDFDRKLLTLTPLEQFVPEGDGAIVPFHFQDNQPEVYGEVDGIAGVFTVDTGDSGSLLLIAPFARRYGLYEQYNATIPYGGHAVGGGTYGVMTRVGEVKLFGADGRGVVAVTKPLTRLSKQKGGFDANRYVSGNIALGILKQFNLTFDYRHQRIIFEKNGLYGKDDPYNRTGLHLKAQGRNWVVSELDPRSPAAIIGIKANDRVLSINGQDALHLNRGALHDLFCQPAGTKLILELQSGESGRTINLVLKDVL